MLGKVNNSDDRNIVVLSKGMVSLLYLTIRPVARKAYGSIAHEAKPNGLLIRGL